MSPDRLSLTFSALADPTRRAILTRLSRGETTVNELAEPFSMSLPAISKHLKVLERTGLIERSRAAQWRPCKLQAAPLKEATDWLEYYRKFWEQSFDRLEVYLQELQAKEKAAPASTATTAPASAPAPAPSAPAPAVAPSPTTGKKPRAKK